MSCRSVYVLPYKVFHRFVIGWLTSSSKIIELARHGYTTDNLNDQICMHVAYIGYQNSFLPKLIMYINKQIYSGASKCWNVMPVYPSQISH